MNDKITNNETVYSINYEIEQLEKRKKELKKQCIEAILQETSEGNI